MSDLENRTNEAADAADPPTGPIKAQAVKGDVGGQTRAPSARTAPSFRT